MKVQFPDAEQYFHIGDTEMDELYARLNGFTFEQVQTMEPHAWMLNAEGVPDWGPQGRGMKAMRLPSATSRGEAGPPQSATETPNWG